MHSDKDYMKQRIIDLMTLPPKQNQVNVRIENKASLTRYTLYLIIAVCAFLLGEIDIKPSYAENFIVDERLLLENWPAKKTMVLPSSFPEIPDIEVIYDPSLSA